MAGIVERAFQLAPQCTSIGELRRLLVKEGYSNIDGHLSATSLRRELKQLLEKS